MKNGYNKILTENLTPSYIFDIDVFNSHIKNVAEILGEKITLCYSIKANSFLIKDIPEEIKYLEVCSPGELTICENTGTNLKNIIFSGVNKQESDVKRAISDGVEIFTVESLSHAEIINYCAAEAGIKVKTIIRLTSGNQFGVDKETFRYIINKRSEYKNLNITGLHYYSGTQKKKASVIEKELNQIDEFLEELKTNYDFHASHVEYGPGLACCYFGNYNENSDYDLLREASVYLKKFALKYNLTVEMGRFFASCSGTYFTQIKDLKKSGEVNYAICDGGIHQLKYYGQTMAMQVPHIEVLNPSGNETKAYSLCGSLCTVADVLVRKAELSGVANGSILAFKKCGAYSVTEGSALFLSRELPYVFSYSTEHGLTMLRDKSETNSMNTPLFE